MGKYQHIMWDLKTTVNGREMVYGFLCIELAKEKLEEIRKDGKNGFIYREIR